MRIFFKCKTCYMGDDWDMRGLLANNEIFMIEKFQLKKLKHVFFEVCSLLLLNMKFSFFHIITQAYDNIPSNINMTRGSVSTKIFSIAVIMKHTKPFDE